MKNICHPQTRKYFTVHSQKIFHYTFTENISLYIHRKYFIIIRPQEMFVNKSCCTLQTWTQFVALVLILYSNILLGFSMFLLTVQLEDNIGGGLRMVVIGSLSTTIIVSFAGLISYYSLFYGVFMEKRKFIKPSLYIIPLDVLTTVTLGILTFAMFGFRDAYMVMHLNGFFVNVFLLPFCWISIYAYNNSLSEEENMVRKTISLISNATKETVEEQSV